jgi:hypothetical protein
MGVAYAPSNVKDAAVGKSFTFIAIVMRNAMGTLMRAASTIVSTPGVHMSVNAARKSACATMYMGLL